MSETTEALIERVLGEHAYNDWPTCACEWQGDLDAAMDGVTSLFDQHRAHVAAAIAEALAESHIFYPRATAQLARRLCDQLPSVDLCSCEAGDHTPHYLNPDVCDHEETR